MRRSSPAVAAFGSPALGMDTRESKAPNAPNLLYNIDVSEKDVWRERPGLILRGGFTGSDGTTAPGGPVMGMYVMRVADRSVLVAIYADSATATMFVRVFKIKYNSSTNYYFENIYSVALLDEDYTNRFFYDFAQAGRFLYFSNGYGNLHQLEWIDSSNSSATDVGFELSTGFLEEGLAPSVMSYITSGLKPSSLQFFFDQIVATGYRREGFVGLSNPLDDSQTEIPEDLVSGARSEVLVSESHVFVSEPALWRSFPLEDSGGMYWLFNEEITATASVGPNLLVFTKKSLFKILGHGSHSPRRVWLADVSLVSARAITDAVGFLFFVAQDGCYITEGETVRKISDEMDSLWYSKEKCETTRTVQRSLRKTPYPFFVNRRRLDTCVCITDRTREQVMVALPSSGFNVNNMIWVWNYSDIRDQTGIGKWSIWSGNEEKFREPSRDEFVRITGIATGGTTTVTTHANHNLQVGYTFKIDGSGMTEINGTQTAAAIPGATQVTFNVNTSGASGSGGNLYPPMGFLTNTDVSGTPITAWHANCMAVDRTPSEDRIFLANEEGYIYILGARQDRIDAGSRDVASVPNALQYQALIGLGRVISPDIEGRAVFTDVGVRRQQKVRNTDDDTNSATIQVIAQSEGEAIKFFNANDADVEYSETTENMQDGVSSGTKSVMGNAANPSMYLGSVSGGTSSPFLRPPYMEAYARLNLPDGDGRGAVIDIYSSGLSSSAAIVPHNIDIKNIWVHASMKGGTQREPT